MPKDKQTYKYELPLDGKMITSQDPTRIGPNFQSLVNMRYHNNTIRGIGGMSKINSTIMDATYFKTKSAHHFKKDQPAESHVLTEAWNTGESAARILQNTTAIGSTGDYSATSLYTPTSTTPGGIFSKAPDGDCAYCNGSESLIWGGDEREIAGLVNYDPDGTFSYDFTEEVRNTKSDSDNVASLTSRSSGKDSNTKLLCHFENNDDDDSPTTPHTLTPNGTITYGTDRVSIGSYRADLTTDGYFSIPDDADFDLSGGTFTLDFWVDLDDLDADYSLFYQNTAADTDSMNVLIDTNGAIVVRIKAGGTKQFSGGTDFQTADGVIYLKVVAGVTLTTLPQHIAIVESGNNWYIFHNGGLVGYTSDAARAANYTGVVQIGYDGTTYLEGGLDEYRLSDTARWTAPFEPESSPYTTDSTQVAFYVGSVRPLDGFKLYIGTANTSASTMTAFYWDGSAWAAVASLSDGTSASSKSLAQTGSVTFTSTVSTAKLKYIDGVMAYWYKVVVSAVASSPTIYYATVSTPMQPIVDIWDGAPRLIDSFQVYDSSTYGEWTINVRENEYNSANTGSYVSMTSMTTGTDYFICGFTDRVSGVVFNFVSGKGNAVVNTVCTVSYWNGTAWTSVGSIDDGTMENNISFAKTGSITWNQITRAEEFPQSISNEANLFYYKFSFSQTLTNPTQIYYIHGIPSQKPISDYKLPAFANDRLWLCSDQKGKKNSVVCSAESSSAVFNGDDSLEFVFGDDGEITGVAWLFTSVGSSIYNVTIFFKEHEMWALIGNSPEEWVRNKYRISSSVGCIAPHSIQVIDIGPEISQTLNRNVVVWQAHDGIYMSDGRSPIKLSQDISDFFDQRISKSLAGTESKNSVGSWDSYNKCYHWMFTPTGLTDHTKELVYDFEKPGWFEISRGSGNILQYMIEAVDTSGVRYNYGFLDTGFTYELENGNDMDGDGIAQYFQTGYMVLQEGSITTETKVEYVCLVATAKTTTDQSIRFRYYMDGNSTRTQWTQSPQKTGYTITYPVEHIDQKGAGIFHSFEVYMATDDETVGFEPQYMYLLYSTQRDHTSDWR
jgi:hypothetical protein